MGTKIKGIAIKTLCVVLCWALAVAPCCYLVSRDFSTDAVGGGFTTVPVLSAHPNDSITPLPNYGDQELIKLPEQNLFENIGVIITTPSDKNLLDYDVFNPTDAAGKAPEPVIKPEPIVPAPDINSGSQGGNSNADIPQEPEQPDPDTGVDTNGNEGFYGDYAILTQPDGSSFIYYDQTWDAYANYKYGSNTIGGYGCGPTSMAMVISNLTGKVVKPTTMADWAYANGYFVSGRGTAYGLFPAAASMYGISCTYISSYDKASIVSALKEGKLLLTIVGPGEFTRGRHFMLIRGITDDGKLLLADSGKYENCLTEWDYNRVINQISGGQFWVFE